MYKYSVLLLLLVAFWAAGEESKSDSSVDEVGDILVDLRTIVQAVRNECVNDTVPVDNLLAATEHLKANIQPDLKKKITAAFRNSSNASGDKMVPLCEGLGELKNIFVNLTGYLVPCFEEDDLKSLQVSYNVFDAVINYICTSHRSDVLNYLMNGGPKCIKENQAELERCGKSTFGSILDDSSEKADEEDKGKSDEEDIDFGIKKEHCDMITNFKTCADKTLKSCPYTSASSTVDGLIDAIVSQLPCYEAEQKLGNNI